MNASMTNFVLEFTLQVALDNEIATYRKLLEGEEIRYCIIIIVILYTHIYPFRVQCG